MLLLKKKKSYFILICILFCLIFSRDLFPHSRQYIKKIAARLVIICYYTTCIPQIIVTVKSPVNIFAMQLMKLWRRSFCCTVCYACRISEKLNTRAISYNFGIIFLTLNVSHCSEFDNV